MSATEGLTQVGNLATHSALSVWNFASDFAIILILVLLFMLFARSIGRGPFVGLLLAFYGAYAVYVTLPAQFTDYLPSAPALTAFGAHLGAYLGITFLFYIILRRVVVSDFLSTGILGIILLSVAGAGLLIALLYNVFDIGTVYRFTPAVDLLFAAKQWFFWWFIAPAVGLFFLAR